MSNFIFVLVVCSDIYPGDFVDRESLTKLGVNSAKSMACKELAALPDNRLKIRIQFI